MITTIAKLLFNLGNTFFSLSLHLHRRFQTPWWTRTQEAIERIEDRLEEMEQLEAMGDEQWWIHSTIQHRVDLFRKEHGSTWRTPNPRDSWLFCVTELAEIGDWMIRNGYSQVDYFRMNERHTSKTSLVMEFGDLLVMLATLADHLGVEFHDAVSLTLEKIERRVARVAREQSEALEAMGEMVAGDGCPDKGALYDEVERVWREFWFPVVTRRTHLPGPYLDLDQIKRELYDYYNFMDEAARVYDAVTDGRISKVNTKASEVIREFEEYTTRLCTEAMVNEKPCKP